jgi:hypothetical protein
VTGVCVKDRDHLAPGFPVSDVICNKLQITNGRRQIPFERQVSDAEGNSKFWQSYWNIDAKRFL